MRAALVLLNRVLRGSLQGLIDRDITETEGCILIQALDCLVKLVKQQQQYRPKIMSDQYNACFRYDSAQHCAAWLLACCRAFIWLTRTAPACRREFATFT